MPSLKRELGTSAAVMLGLGAMIGTGVFVSFGLAAGVVGDAVLLSILIAAMLASCNALSSAQLAASHPVSGGTYEYGYEYLTPTFGFSAGWMFLCAKSASAAAAALGFAGYLCKFFGFRSERVLVPIAIWSVVAITALVVTGMRRSSRVNTIIVTVVIASLGALVFLGLPIIVRETNPVPLASYVPRDLSSLLEASALMFVAFTGYGRVATLGEEVRDPARTIPKAIVTTVAIATVVYLLVAWVAVRSVGYEALESSAKTDAAPLEMVALVFGGHTLRRIVAIGALFALSGVLLNLILGLSRVVLAMARRGDAPGAFAEVSGDSRSPDRAVLIVSVIIVALTLVGGVSGNWSLSAFTVLIYYSVTNLAALSLPAGRRLYPRVIPVLGLIGCLGLAVFVDPKAIVFGSAVLLAGLVGRAIFANGPTARTGGTRTKRIETREIAAPTREALIALTEKPGAALLEGWGDDGRYRIALPEPEEIRELSWNELDRSEDFLRGVSEPMRPGSPEPEPPVENSANDLEKENAAGLSSTHALPFSGGWVGFIGYEIGASWENALPRPDSPAEPAAWFARHDLGLVVRPDGSCVVFGPPEKLSAFIERIDSKRNAEAPTMTTPEGKLESDSLGDGAYQRAVDDIRERISWGDVYQVNLTRRFVVDTDADPAAVYVGMTGEDPPRCSAFIRGDGWSMASASPEVFLRYDPSLGVADSRPIKGTLRRSGDSSKDDATLLASAKDEAEHLMIVDLVRNDLGKVAPPGCVRVREYKGLRALAHVLHLESIVEGSGLGQGRLLPLLGALFPAGSITGAPKRAAVHAIREIEPCSRGVYTGAIGMIDARGVVELSVAIRTAVISGHQCRYHAGGGIVWDSDPEAENAESIAKSIDFLRTFGVEIE